jgi:hypothetical protein
LFDFSVWLPVDKLRKHMNRRQSGFFAMGIEEVFLIKDLKIWRADALDQRCFRSRRINLGA